MKIKGKRSPLMAEEKERAKILAASGQSLRRIARATGRDRSTVTRYLFRPEVRKLVAVNREQLAGMFDSVAHQTLAGVTAEDVERATLQQKLVSAGIAVDKAALLRGEAPMSINLNLFADVAEAIRALRDGNRLPPVPALTAPAPE